MKQVLQNLGTGQTELIETPCPQIKPGFVLIKTSVSLISTGTERTAISDSKVSIVDKVIKQPSKLKKAWDLYKTEGLDATMGAIKKQFDFPITMGYSNVGTVIGVGRGVNDFKIGDRVLSNGPHSEVVNVPKNLCAKIPDNVSDEQAVFTVLSSIGLQGVRLVNPTLGETIAVMGLGVIGLLTVQILKANGCNVIAIDLNKERVELAKTFGATGINLSQGQDPIKEAMLQTDNVGIDGVIITAATHSNTPIEQSAQMCRKRGRIVLTGVVGLNIDRNLFYEKELSFQVSCSYGPGRYDKSYEAQGIDYPLPFVRWTQKRNFQACLKLMAENKINSESILKDKYDVAEIKKVYEQINSETPPLTVLLKYPSSNKVNQKTIKLSEAKPHNPDKCNIAILGVGNYSTNMIIPSLNKCDANIVSLASQSGLSSTLLAKKLNISESTTDLNSLYTRDDINTLIIATQHNSHSELVVKALNNNKNVFVEKPLSIDQLGIEKIKKAYNGNNHVLVGFNRRFSPLTQEVNKELESKNTPRFIQMNINAGFIPNDHWTQDPSVGGGRLIGEACHFIDLSRFLAGSKITSVFCKGMRNSGSLDENISIMLQFENGSISSINYYANGAKSFAKENISVSQSGMIYHIDNFKTLNVYGASNHKTIKLKKQDKGQTEMFSRFLSSIEQNSDALISFDEIIEVSEATIKARKLLS